MSDVKSKGYLECFKWQGGRGLLLKVAWLKDLSIDITTEKTGWVKELYRFEVTGDSDDVKEFNRIIKTTIDNHGK